MATGEPRRFSGRRVAAVALPMLALAAAMPALAAAPAPVPRVEGVYFSGAWEDPIPPEVLRPAGSPPAPRVVPDPPLNDAARAEMAARRQRQQQAPPELSGGAACIPGGFPAMMGPVFPIEVLQSPGQVTIIAEAFSQVRRIYLNEPQIAVEDAEPLFWGHSVGRWEGNTLVVNTIGLKETVRMSGVPHSPHMRVDERITVTSPDSWEDQITITDPVYLTKPWTWTYKYVRKKGYRINEYVCEDNRLYLDPQTGQQRLKLGE